MKYLIFLLLLIPAMTFAQPCADEDTVRNNAVSLITATSARINGTTTHFAGTVLSISLKYVRTGLTDTVTATVAGTSALRNISGLQASTSYTYYYRSTCNTGTVNQSGSYTFTTLTSAVVYATERSTVFPYVKSDSGMIMPRMATLSLNRSSGTPGGNIAFNTSDSLPYYYNGVEWKYLAVDSAGILPALNLKVDSVTVSGDSLFYWINGTGYGYILPANDNDWQLDGNAGTTAGTNFIGTTDSVDLVMKANSKERIRIADSAWRIGNVLTYIKSNNVGNRLHIYTDQTSTDTSSYKPLGVKSDGEAAFMDYWPGGGGGGVTSVATNNGSGITGGTITTTGTIAADTTNVLATKDFVTYPDSLIFRTNSVFTAPTSMISFGNSITIGPPFCTADSVYVARIRDYTSLTLDNQAVSGSGVWSATGLSYANVDPGHLLLETYMAGFNDLRRGGSDGKTYNKIINSLKANWLNHFSGVQYPANGGDGSIIKSGTWATYSANTVGGKYADGAFTTTSGDYIEFSFNGTGVGVGLISFDSVNQAGARFLCTIDGVSQGAYFSENQQTDGISDGVNNNQRGAMALVFSGLSQGNHTIRLTSDQSTNVFAVDYFATLASTGTYPPLVWFAPPKMNGAGYATAPANASDAIMDAMETKMDSLTLALPQGYAHYLVKTNDYYNVATGLGGDNIHPNDVGQGQFFDGYLATLPTIPIYSDNTLIASDRPFWNYNGVMKQIAFSDEISPLVHSEFIQNQTSTTQNAAFKISGASTISNLLSLGSASITGNVLNAKVASDGNINLLRDGNNTISSVNDANTTGQSLSFFGSGYNWYSRVASANTLILALSNIGDLTSTGYLRSNAATHVLGAVVSYPGAGVHLQYTGGEGYIDGYNGASWNNINMRAADLTFANSGTRALTLTGGKVGVGANATSPTTMLEVAGRFAARQGADVASAAGAIALGTDGNSFEITGTAAITLISNSNWVNGSEVTLLFTSTATLTDGTANSGTDIGMELAGNTNFVASAGATLKLILSEIGGTQRWREVGRSVN